VSALSLLPNTKGALKLCTVNSLHDWTTGHVTLERVKELASMSNGISPLLLDVLMARVAPIPTFDKGTITAIQQRYSLNQDQANVIAAVTLDPSRRLTLVQGCVPCPFCKLNCS